MAGGLCSHDNNRSSCAVHHQQRSLIDAVYPVLNRVASPSPRYRDSSLHPYTGKSTFMRATALALTGCLPSAANMSP